jgi:hypothetical protein
MLLEHQARSTKCRLLPNYPYRKAKQGKASYVQLNFKEGYYLQVNKDDFPHTTCEETIQILELRHSRGHLGEVFCRKFR